MPAKVTVSNHPLVQDKLSALRDKRTRPEDFRRILGEVSGLMAYDIFKGLRTRRSLVQTPLKSAQAEYIDQEIALVAILRAGLGMVDGVSEIVPNAQIGHIGLYRNEESLNPVRYYVRLPKQISESFVVLCDPMLATGGSASEAIQILKTDGARQISLLTLLSSKTGIKRVQEAHPDVPIHTAVIDPILNKSGYIVPGLGDAGDRIFGT
jgi:uracil phosphoribosyltransferase